jgi:phytoene dehydrogenase-like protein
VPYALDGDPRNWDDRRLAGAEKLLARWRQFAPNLTPDNVRSMLVVTPLDTERRFPNFRMGDLGVGWAGPGQLRHARPFPGAGRYRMAIPGLYLCGGATHPGGNITGLPGYNAARVIVEDLGLKTWWHPPDPELLWS